MLKSWLRRPAPRPKGTPRAADLAPQEAAPTAGIARSGKPTTPARQADGPAHTMPRAHRTGREGEEAAADHVRRLGWTVLDRNWRHGHLELDLVCRDGDVLVFVEVKTRAAGGPGTPAEALTPAKQANLVRAARAWLAAHDAWSEPCRFDLAAVIAHAGSYHTELYHHVMELGDGARHAQRGGHTPWQPW